MRAFIDTNVFLYAFLDQDVAKKHVAVECIANAVRERNGNAISLKDRYGLQFFDALMVVAAVAGGCDTILTEDLNDGQVYCGVRAVNPFAHDGDLQRENMV